MKTIPAVIYARVSSEQQAAAHTTESQLAGLTARARSDGMSVPANASLGLDSQSFSSSRRDPLFLSRLATRLISPRPAHRPVRFGLWYLFDSDRPHQSVRECGG